MRLSVAAWWTEGGAQRRYAFVKEKLPDLHVPYAAAWADLSRFEREMIEMLLNPYMPEVKR